MNKAIMESMGYKEELRLIKEGKCPLCKEPISEFRDFLSKKEYEISGLCQSCQDDVFEQQAFGEVRDE